MNERIFSASAISDRHQDPSWACWVNSLPDGVVGLDCDGCIVAASEPLCLLYRALLGDILGRAYWCFLADRARIELAQKSYSFVCNTRPPARVHYSRQRRADGEVISIQARWSYVFDPGGQLRGIVALVRDYPGELSPEQTRLMIEDVGVPAECGKVPHAEALTRREQEVLTQLLQGRAPGDIAGSLHLSLHTVRNHVKAIHRKLDVHSREELLTEILQGRLVPSRAGHLTY